MVYCLQKTRRYKVICIDNLHNAHSKALERVSKIAKDALPGNATDDDRDSAEIVSHTADLTKADEVTAVFEKYGKGGIWGVIHIAVCPPFSTPGMHFSQDVRRLGKLSANRQKYP